MFDLLTTERDLFISSRSTGRIKPMIADDQEIAKARAILQWAKALKGPIAEVHAKALIEGLEAALKVIDQRDRGEKLARLLLDILVQCTVELSPGWFALKSGEREIFNWISAEARKLQALPSPKPH